MPKRKKRDNNLPKGLDFRSGRYVYTCPLGYEYALGTSKKKALDEVAEVNLMLYTRAMKERKPDDKSEFPLLTHEEVVANAVPLDEVCGVYFLVHQGRVVYVGSSIHIHSRIREHMVRGGKWLDSYHFEKVHPLARLEVEAMYIEALDPPYNFNQPRSKFSDRESAQSARSGKRMGERIQAIEKMLK